MSADSGQTALQDIGLPDRPEIRGLARNIAAHEAQRAPVDLGWIGVFGLPLFAIHLGRTGFDRTFLGVMTPSLAVLGDIVVALIAAFVVIVPLRLTWRKLTRRAEQRSWSWCLAVPESEMDRRHRLVRTVLTWRLRDSIRLRQARYSLRSALSRGLQIGLPIAAIIAATAPVFGMSWYFDTEDWAAGIWSAWAEERTDTWRVAMVQAEETLAGPGDATFSITPAGVNDGHSRNIKRLIGY